MPRSLPFLLATCALASAATLAACGSRGPLDIGSVDEQGGDVDASDLVDAEEASAPIDASADAGHDGASGRDAGGFFFDSGTPAINCTACVFSQCGQGVLTCISDPQCGQVLQCVATTCLGGGGGGVNPGCAIQCGASDPAALLQILNIFQCITGNCGTACAGLLGGGGIGGGRDGGRPPPPDASGE
jgi:predicted small lipoprotein YifL